MRPLWRIDFHTWLNHRLGIGTRTSVVVFHSREVLHPILEVHKWQNHVPKEDGMFHSRWFQMTSSSAHLGALVRLGYRFIFILKGQVLIVPSVRFQRYQSLSSFSLHVLVDIHCFFGTWNENKPCSWLVLKKQTFVTYVIVFVVCDVGLGFSSFRPWSMICLHLIFLWVFPIPGLW